MTITEIITTTKQGIAIAELFALKYEAKLPEHLQRIQIDRDTVTLCFSLEYDGEDSRNATLFAIGSTFGWTDWRARIAYDNLAYHWEKEVDGVKVTIMYAQKTEKQQGFPVSPTAFPLQLVETTPEVTENLD